jgi:NAD-dependent deacetylase
VVYPAASFPAEAKQQGAKLAIVTLSETPLDGIADLVINRPIGDVVQALAS